MASARSPTRLFGSLLTLRAAARQASSLVSRVQGRVAQAAGQKAKTMHKGWKACTQAAKTATVAAVQGAKHNKGALAKRIASLGVRVQQGADAAAASVAASVKDAESAMATGLQKWAGAASQRWSQLRGHAKAGLGSCGKGLGASQRVVSGSVQSGLASASAGLCKAQADMQEAGQLFTAAFQNQLDALAPSAARAMSSLKEAPAQAAEALNQGLQQVNEGLAGVARRVRQHDWGATQKTAAKVVGRCVVLGYWLL